MAVNRKCPKCGSERVQLTNEGNKHGCLYTILFGFIYIFWLFVKWTIGFMILICYDWWMAIIKNSQGKGFIWQSKRWFSNRRQVYYCHDCGYNFRG